jgi:hypothetical protein
MQRQDSPTVSRIWWTVSVIQDTYTVKQDIDHSSKDILSVVIDRRFRVLNSTAGIQL